MGTSSRSPVIFAYAIVSTVWGSTYLAIRIAVQTVPPFMLGALRFLIAGAILFAALRLRGHRAPRGVEWLSALGTGALYFVVGNGFLNLAEQSVSTGLASILIAMMPLWTTLFSRFLGEKPSLGEQAGIALGLGGVALMNLGADFRASGSGVVWAILAPVGWALATLANKRLPLPPGPMGTAAQMLAGGLALSAVSALSGERIPASPGAPAVLAVAYLAIFGSLVGFSAYTFLLQNTRATVATSYAYVNPIVAIALGVTFLHERMDRATAAGALVVLASVLLVTRAKSARTATVAPAPAPASPAAADRA
jgi:drug/metabolite transporter (DMT)-like permease